MTKSRAERFLEQFLKEAYITTDPNTLLNRLELIVNDADQTQKRQRINDRRRGDSALQTRSARMILPNSRENFVLTGELEPEFFKKCLRMNVLMDGNCLFRSFALKFANNQNRYDEYRKIAVTTVTYDPVLSQRMENGWDRSMIITGTWGDSLAIEALSKSLRVMVRVFRIVNQQVLEVVIGESGANEIWLFNETRGEGDDGYHFDLLVPNETRV